MKYFKILLVALHVSIFSTAFPQVMENFSDGNFTENPAWYGDTSHFIVNANGQLQLSAPAVAGQSYLATASEIINNATWSFYIKLDFNPSSANYLDVYLVSDSDILTAPLNGYFVRIGNTQDEVSLYRQSGNRSSAAKIIDGLDGRVNVSLVELRVRVTKNAESTWELLVDSELSGDFVSEGSVIDGTHTFSRYFGIFCVYTVTRSDKFYFDDLSIDGEAFYDPDPPMVDSLLVTSDSTLLVIFNESLHENSAVDLNNYFINNGIGNPTQAEVITAGSVSLVFRHKFQDKTINRISIHGVQDLFGNALNNFVTDFTFYAPYIIRFGDLIVSEIMADPLPEVNLPPYEYVELFNTTTQYLEVEKMYLVVGRDSVPVPDFSLGDGSFLILCQSAAVAHLQQFGPALRVPNWPSLNNRGERISLYNQLGELVFTVEYADTWYQSIEKKDGGWSLEMIDTDYPCKGRENWKASIDPSGGTPGKKNASSDQLTDLKGPEIIQAIASGKRQLRVSINEKLKPVPLNLALISTIPNLEISSALLKSPELDVIQIELNEDIQANIMYGLTIRGLEDCVGNKTPEAIAKFILPLPADSLDVIINEILFNPWPNGFDFVELYNQSEKYIDLKGWGLGNKTAEIMTEAPFLLEPKQFLAITEDFESLNNHYPGVEQSRVLQASKLPPFNDDEGEVKLYNADGRLLDYFQYHEDIHSPFLKDVEGVSLERISFTGTSNDPVNWQSAASTAGYATPGKMNSQHFAAFAESGEVVVEPQVFDPGGDGNNNFTLIKCKFDQPGNMASIKVVDASGREVKTIALHQSIGTEEVFKWEGESDNGQEVRLGYYIVYLEIYNAEGARKIYRKKVVVGGRM